MSALKTIHPVALQFLMTEDLYALADATVKPEALAIAPAVAVEDAPTFFEYVGENNKYVLILLNDAAHKTISPKELETLQNILKGKKQDLKDVAILNLHQYPTATFKALKDFFACNALILFGINPAQLQLEGIQANEITLQNGTRILATFSIAEMLQHVDKKRVFWEEMKKL